MKYAIFDDHKIDNFYPLTLTRSTGDLRVGILKLRQRIAAYLETEESTLIVPKHLQNIYVDRHLGKAINTLSEGEYIFVNSRLKICDSWVEKIKQLPVNTRYCEGDITLAARMTVQPREITSEELSTIFNRLSITNVDKDNCWEFIWELITCNGEYIEQDFQDFFYDEDNHYEVEMGVTIANPYNVWIGEGAVLSPGVVIDASEGAVVLDEGCKILPNSVITGPVYIGKNSIIKATSKIYEGTSIGPVCKIAGEVEATIIQGFTNKQHDGFLGHSYLGEWINIGANTNNSDLKNNYKPVSIFFYPHKEKINSGCMFLGCLIGDHSKTAISTVINTGTVIGVGCNLFGNELIKDHIPSFSWGGGNNRQEYRLDDFFDTADIVKNRRKLSFSESEKDLYKYINK